MNDRYTAMEFVHPDFGRRPGDTPAREQWGIQLSANRSISLVHGEAAVRQSVLMLLTTRPGERLMRPEYGCRLHTLLFSPNDDTTAGLAIHYVRQALDRWEPRIRVLRLDAERNPDAGEILDIHLEYRVLATNRIEQVSVPVALSGEGF